MECANGVNTMWGHQIIIQVSYVVHCTLVNCALPDKPTYVGPMALQADMVAPEYLSITR